MVRRRENNKRHIMTDWNPNLYMKYGNERTQPSIDLVARIASSSPQEIIDLGCGPGNSTSILKNRWPNAMVAGLDSSEGMIKQARKDYPNQEWIVGDISDWVADKEYDLIFSNAALQWIPEHQIVFPKLVGFLKDSGVLAVQVPFHYDSPLHKSIVEVSEDERWTGRMNQARSALTYKPASFYYDVLSSISSSLAIWMTEYYHVMESPEAVLDWISGTGLRPFIAALETEEANDFKKVLLGKYIDAYARQKDDKVIFPFKRQFIVATK
ncbi:methyltransferase domain-containing protein [bacterium]|nr:methyltransferase domain-containing protein [bacterium]